MKLSNADQTALPADPALHLLPAPTPPDTDDLLTLADARIALEAVQRMNSKLESENASLKERLELLDQLVVKLLKRIDKLTP